jgi:predicted RNA-binding Zn ribbon-like protein
LSGAERDVVNDAAAREVPVPKLGPEGQVRWTASDPVAAVLSTTARDALDLALSPDAVRVRRCAGPDCEALFLDLSRPGSRRWCSMDTCGNRAKKRRLRGS